MVDDFDGDSAGLGFGEWATLCAVNARPGRFVELGTQRALEFFVGFVRTNKVGVTDKEALAIVVGVDGPAGDIVGGGVTDFPGRRVVNIEALDLDFITSIGLGQRIGSDIFISSQ